MPSDGYFLIVSDSGSIDLRLRMSVNFSEEFHLFGGNIAFFHNI